VYPPIVKPSQKYAAGYAELFMAAELAGPLINESVPGEFVLDVFQASGDFCPLAAGDTMR